MVSEQRNWAWIYIEKYSAEINFATFPGFCAFGIDRRMSCSVGVPCRELYSGRYAHKK